MVKILDKKYKVAYTCSQKVIWRSDLETLPPNNTVWRKTLTK